MALLIGPIIRKIKASLDPESQQQQQQGPPPQQFQPQQFQPQPLFLAQQHQQHQHRLPCPSGRRGRRHARDQMRAARRCGRADGPGWCRGPPAAAGHCHPQQQQQQQQQSRPAFAANYGPQLQAFPDTEGYYERRSFERAPPPPPAVREMTDARRHSNEDVAPPAYESEDEDEEDHYVQNGKGGGRVKV